MIIEWSTPLLHSVNVNSQGLTIVKHIEGNTFNAPIPVNTETRTSAEKCEDLKDTRIQQRLKIIIMIAFTYS